MRSLTVLLLSLLAFQVHATETLHVIAPANLRNHLKGTAVFFEKNQPEWKTDLRFLPAADIAKQIEKGGAADVVLFSGKQGMEALAKKKLIQNPLFLFSNPVVIVAPPAIQIKEAKELLEHKPAALLEGQNGKRNKEYLKTIGFQENSETTMNVKTQKAAFEAVRLGKAKWAFAYRSEAARQDGMTTIWTVDALPAQEFHVAVVSSSHNLEAAKAFQQSLFSTIALKIWENAGFIIPKTPKPQKPKKSKE